MRKNWMEPQIEVQQFMANEYVAACGDQNKVYKFVCDAPGGRLFYYPTGDDNIDGNYTGNGKAEELTWFLSSYSPCGETHEAPTTDSFYDGYVLHTGLFGSTTTEKVIVWRGKNNNNGHATAQLDMDSWQTAKS